MQLSDFLDPATHSAATPAPTRTVRFKLANARVVANATAELAFVVDEKRLEALRDADKHIAKTYSAEPSVSARWDEEMYFILQRALRDSDDVEKPFARTPLELRNALVFVEARRVYDEYLRFVREEFPADFSPEEFLEIVEDAKKKPLPILLSERGSEQIRSVLPSLVAHFGKYPQPTSTDTEQSA